ncbi:MAG: endonuclease [Paludibacteraceae bacterium]|nr:endonuclease [Paludibacteraceae bacterium]
MVSPRLYAVPLREGENNEPLRVVSYNVENLFYPERDSVNSDSVFTPEGERRWSYTRYYRKVENIARVLTVIGEWDGVDIIGLQEVESRECVERICKRLRGDYGFVHYDSPDKRGIDVAMVYKKTRLDTIRSERLKVKGEREGEQLITRDILYVSGIVDKRDTIHFFVCHLPSQLGGKAESEWKRQCAKAVLQQAVDSILAVEETAKIVVMGDMNSAPKEDLQGLRNKMKIERIKDIGTHKYKGRWTCLDQFYLSEGLDSISEMKIFDAEWIQETDEKYLGLRPKRTYNGFRYQEGFSDHLPIVLNINL